MEYILQGVVVGVAKVETTGDGEVSDTIRPEDYQNYARAAQDYRKPARKAVRELLRALRDRDESIAQLRTGGLLGVDPEPMTSFWVPL